MAYTTIDKSSLHFNTKIYSGNATDNTAITGVGFTPSFLWGKNRTDATNHYLIDAVRGVTKNLKSQTNAAEATDTAVLKSFDSDGFTLGDGSLNQSSHTFVTWNWKANGQGSSNTDGTINSTYTSVNTTSGFSIVKFTASGSGGTVGHGLGVAPKVIIFKRLDAASDWSVYHESVGNVNMVFLNTTTAASSNASILNSTSPTSSVFTVGSSNIVTGGPVIAYCFAEKTGFSKFGEYTGNENANGTFVYTGFKPAFVMIKNRGASSTDWFIHDNKRLGYNEKNYGLFPNLTNAEATDINLDLLSNGFKLRRSTNQLNHAGNYYIYMAFAEAPLVASNNVPATAR